MKRFILASAAALALSGCALFGGGTLTDEQKGLLAVHDVYHTTGCELRAAAADSTLATDGKCIAVAAPTVLLHGAAALRARTIYDQAGAVIKAADDADSIGDASGTAAKVAAAMSLIVEVLAIIHPTPAAS